LRLIILSYIMLYLIIIIIIIIIIVLTFIFQGGGYVCRSYALEIKKGSPLHFSDREKEIDNKADPYTSSAGGDLYWVS